MSDTDLYMYLMLKGAMQITCDVVTLHTISYVQRKRSKEPDHILLDILSNREANNIC
jgi:hypothetical protein